MITLHPKPGIELFTIEVDIEANEFEVKRGALHYYEFSDASFKIRKPLPAGNYSFIATSKDITEEQAAELVEKTFNAKGKRIGWKDYRYEGCSMMYAGASLFSLLRSQGLDPSTKNYAILKRENQ